MMEGFEHKGKWWLPGEEDSQIDGTLTYSPADGAILELSGAFGDLSRAIGRQGLSTARIILGTTASGNRISLLNCAESHRSLGAVYGPGYATTSYRVQVALVGTHFPSYEEVTFASLHVHYSHLDAWSDFQYFDYAQEEGVKKISYTSPAPTVAHLGDGVTISVTSAGSERWEGSPVTCVTIEREARIGIQIGERAHFDEFLNPIRLTQIFLSLGVGAAVHPMKVTGSRQEMVEDVMIPRPVEIFYRPPRAAPPQRTLLPSDMTFTLAGITDRFEPFLRNWFDNADLLRPVVNLYFATLPESVMFAEQRFLTLTRALESFHRQRHGGQYLSPEKYTPAREELVAAIPDWISGDHRDALRTRLKYGYEYSLRKRLGDLFDAHEPVLRDVFPDTTTFIDKIVKTRNYLTHYDEDDSQDAAIDGLELHRLATELRTLLEVCLLSEIGFTPEEICKQVQEICSRRVIEGIEYE